MPELFWFFFPPQRASVTGLVYQPAVDELKKKKNGSELWGSENKERNEIRHKIQKFHLKNIILEVPLVAQW